LDIIELARRYHAHEKVDGTGDTFQRRARILQSMWREGMGYGVGMHRGRPLGSRLPMPWARESLANFLTDGIRDVVREEVLDPVGSRGKLYGRPRIFDDLLSSKPLAFNAFGELRRHLDLATAILRELSGGRIGEVTGIDFEHSPGRGDLAYIGDRSAFDVYIEFVPPGGGRGFAAVEIKYHENLRGKPSTHKARYDEVADDMGCFLPSSRDRLRAMPLQQLFRDHLLAGSLRQVDGFDDGFFAVLHPAGNQHCARAVAEYAMCLGDGNTFVAWTLEDLVAALRRHTDAGWVEMFHDRYLDFGRVDRELGRLAADEE